MLLSSCKMISERSLMPKRLLFLSEDPKHVDEEIDEVEVEGERAEDSELHTFIGGVRVVGESDLADAR